MKVAVPSHDLIVSVQLWPRLGLSGKQAQALTEEPLVTGRELPLMPAKAGAPQQPKAQDMI